MTTKRAATAQRLRETARVAFSRGSYDAIGLRDIASDAGVDAALVIRYFGSKEALFREVAADAFSEARVLHDDLATLGTTLASALSRAIDPAWAASWDPFRFLICSLSSELAAPIVGAAFQAGFVTPLARRLGGKDADVRAALIAAYILGFAALRVPLGAPALQTMTRRQRVAMSAYFAGAVDACVRGEAGG